MVRQVVFGLCMALAGSGNALAASESGQATPPAWRIAPEVSHYRYKEPGVMKNEGTLYGIVGSYTFYNAREDAAESDSASWSTIRLDGRLSGGEVDYDGSFMDGTPLSTSGSDDFLFDVRALFGHTWRPARFCDGAYAGLGYRHLRDDSSQQIGGYRRESNYLYIPLGIQKGFDLTTRWNLALAGEFDVLLIGRQISHLDDANPALPTVRNWQWPGFGGSLSLDLVHAYERVNVGFGPFLRYWWIAESEVSNEGYYEPENNTIEYGLSFVIRF